jgi:hypothetical protein
MGAGSGMTTGGADPAARTDGDTSRPTPTADATQDGAGDLLTVHIIGLPLGVQREAQQHADELIRELTLVGEGLRQQGNTGGLPARLVQLVEDLTHTYSGFTADQEQQLADAIDAGLDTLDLTYRLPASVTGAVQVLSDILDEADEFCRAGEHLLTLATPPELVTYRRWYLTEFVRQAHGQPPRAWADYRSP